MRPTCECHQEPMRKSGIDYRRGREAQRWACGVKRRAKDRALYASDPVHRKQVNDRSLAYYRAHGHEPSYRARAAEYGRARDSRNRQALFDNLMEALSGTNNTT